MAVKAASPRVVVIGAGLGGVTMVVKLKKAGFTDFVVLEARTVRAARGGFTGIPAPRSM